MNKKTFIPLHLEPTEKIVVVKVKDESLFHIRLAKAQGFLRQLEHDLYECSLEIAEKLGLTKVIPQ